MAASSLAPDHPDLPHTRPVGRPLGQGSLRSRPPKRASGHHPQVASSYYRQVASCYNRQWSQSSFSCLYIEVQSSLRSLVSGASDHHP